MQERPRADPPLPGFSPRALPERGYCPWVTFTLWSHSRRPAWPVGCFLTLIKTRMQTETTSSMWAPGNGASAWLLGSPRALSAAEGQDVHCPVWSRGTWLWEGEAGREPAGLAS